MIKTLCAGGKKGAILKSRRKDAFVGWRSVSEPMYLHIGNHKNIREKDIIGIFDTDNATVAKTTCRFLSASQKRGEVSAASEEIPKSFVLYKEKGKNRICFSQLSTASLSGRCGDALGESSVL